MQFLSCKCMVFLPLAQRCLQDFCLLSTMTAPCFPSLRNMQNILFILQQSSSLICFSCKWVLHEFCRTFLFLHWYNIPMDTEHPNREFMVSVFYREHYNLILKSGFSNYRIILVSLLFKVNAYACVSRWSLFPRWPGWTLEGTMGSCPRLGPQRHYTTTMKTQSMACPSSPEPI